MAHSRTHKNKLYNSAIPHFGSTLNFGLAPPFCVLTEIWIFFLTNGENFKVVMLVQMCYNKQSKHFLILKLTSNSKIVPENKFGFDQNQNSTLNMQVWHMAGCAKMSSTCERTYIFARLRIWCWHRHFVSFFVIFFSNNYIIAQNSIYIFFLNFRMNNKLNA